MKDIKLGMVASAVFHVTLISVSVVGVPALMRPAPEIPDAIPVEIVDIADIIRFSRPENQLEPAPEAPVRTAEARPKPQAIQPEASPEKDAIPLPDAKPLKKPPPQKPIEKPAVIPQVAPRTKPKPPSSLDTSRLAALIDRSVEQDNAARRQKQDEQKERDRKIDEAVRDAQVSRLASLRSTTSIEAAIQRKFERCWSPVGGAKDAAELVITIRLFLKLDGTFSRPPEVLNDSFFGSGDSNFYQVAVERALNAARRCAPYELPRDSYDQWRQIDLNFDPRDMLGG